MRKSGPGALWRRDEFAPHLTYLVAMTIATNFYATMPDWLTRRTLEQLIYGIEAVAGRHFDIYRRHDDFDDAEPGDYVSYAGVEVPGRSARHSVATRPGDYFQRRSRCVRDA